MSMGFDPPLVWAKLDEPTRAASWADTDFCEINYSDGNTERFIHCVLPLPVPDIDAEFTFAVWCSVSEKSWEIYKTGYGGGDYAEKGCFGFLIDHIPDLENTRNLPADLWFQPAGLRPRVELHDGPDPLIFAQREGVEPAQIERWASMMHQPPEAS
jgi:hypothetical protein